jgi:hypothetical protein
VVSLTGHRFVVHAAASAERIKFNQARDICVIRLVLKNDIVFRRPLLDINLISTHAP